MAERKTTVKAWPVLVVVIASIAVCLSGCNTDDLSCERASDQQGNLNEALPLFDAINSTVVADVQIFIAQEYRLEASGPKNVVDALLPVVEDGELLISSTECFTGTYVLEISVYAPEVRAVTLSGIGTISSGTALTAPDISIVLSGVGDIDLQVSADSVHTELTGTGNAKLGGSAPIHHIVATGVAALESFALETEKTHILSNTPEDARVFVNSELTGSLLGPGDIYYRGTPQIDIEDTGPGQLIDDN